MSRSLFAVVLAVLLAFDLSAARADLPPPKPDDPRLIPPGPPQTRRNTPIDPVTGLPYPPPAPRDPPQRRTGPFRSCGSGMGLGLAGIGATWGMLWLGNRLVRSQRSPSTRG